MQASFVRAARKLHLLFSAIMGGSVRFDTLASCKIYLKSLPILRLHPQSFAAGDNGCGRDATHIVSCGGGVVLKGG